MSKMSYRVNKNDDSFVFLDYLYMNIEWLINQDSLYIYIVVYSKMISR